MQEQKYITATITKIIEETIDAKTFILNLGSVQDFAYKAGQYVNVNVNIDGSEYIRAYSLSSSPAIDKYISLTIKKSPEGLVSNYIVDNFQVGDSLKISYPEGNFIVEPNENKSDIYIFFGSGSGITPLYSQIKTTLSTEKDSVIYLFYGNKNFENAIFHNELNELERVYFANFKRIDILSKPTAEWKGDTGRITKQKAIGLLQKHARAFIEDAQYFICGENEMIESVILALHELSVDNKSIHTEFFTIPITTTDEINSKASVYLYGENIELEIYKEETILSALKRNGHEAPHSCLSGVCSSCKAALTEGSATMIKSDALDEDDVAKGYILTCQAVPSSKSICINFHKKL